MRRFLSIVAFISLISIAVFCRAENPAAAKLVDERPSSLRLERRRLLVTGLSMGGGGTWSLISAQPEKYAPAMPLCGRGDLQVTEKIAKTPIWVLVGDEDKAETVQNCRDM